MCEKSTTGMKPTADFLLQLATMTISMITRQRCPSSNHLSAAFVNEILSRKCNKLEINTEMSLNDMEKLLQYFHHSDKTVPLTISTWHNTLEINTQVGSFAAKNDIDGRINI
ncbi:hypothetical protein PRIPAC_72250, partial [Pristionchus pacificus]|uniref:Uncharacterized protein n=1 Tax=Pristionchus pacificus TaxID=54126 RepID=A0A2A6CZZ8_PRIPA